ncbi:SAM-dependent methyltransferase [Streptosporangium becharense]|uniref:SAM-dependent methyltransferase n=1 Tax=Streptosporangium becharense TaxID=1816182 RepID=A0A7W9MES5_9ACTN|nr:class I SAM-dependent methyltransferase [Streptosporangium becharense]MBB2915046.1 SAM-dependent methyltransferase [Streptosporangium becharense]MBB5818095.1 SAM-dependent methyltransferase [Streptosporangium becharense]
MSWREAGEDILDLRRRVFTDELGWPEEWIRHGRDAEGLHLCAFADGRMVAAISAYVYEPEAPELASVKLPEIDGPTVEIGKRVELPSHRGHLISAQIGTSMLRQICESLRPSRFFLIVRVKRFRHLIDRYARRRFVYHTEIGSGDDAIAVMKVDGEDALDEFYLKHRELTRDASAGEGAIPVPSLVRFLADNDRSDLLAAERLGAENNYLQPLSLDTEASRLTAQGRMILAEQLPRLASAPFPTAPASLLDIGTGTGEYLAAVTRENRFAGYRVHGIEPVPHLLARARSNFPQFEFRQGSAYLTGEPDSSHDVITANFLFVHLRSPDLALLEMRRVLKPGGLLYVVDVDDSSFSGPEVAQRMIESYDRDYIGDRVVMKDLPGRAGEFGFRLLDRFRTRLRNTGDREPLPGRDEIRLGVAEAWSLLSFVRSQPGIEPLFQEAREHCFGSGCEISMNLETQVYRLAP